MTHRISRTRNLCFTNVNVPDHLGLFFQLNGKGAQPLRLLFPIDPTVSIEGKEIRVDCLGEEQVVRQNQQTTERNEATQHALFRTPLGVPGYRSRLWHSVSGQIADCLQMFFL